MTPDQSKMARAALSWSLTELAAAAGVGRATAARFEIGQSVSDDKVAALQKAFEGHQVRFITDGSMAGGVYRVSRGS